MNTLIDPAETNVLTMTTLCHIIGVVGFKKTVLAIRSRPIFLRGRKSVLTGT